MQFVMELLGTPGLIESLSAAFGAAIDALDAWVKRIDDTYDPIRHAMDRGYDGLLWALMRPLERDRRNKKTS